MHYNLNNDVFYSSNWFQFQTLFANELWVGLNDMSFVLTPEPYMANGGGLGAFTIGLAFFTLTADAERNKPPLPAFINKNKLN